MYRKQIVIMLIFFFSTLALFSSTTHHRLTWDRDPAHNAVIGFSPDGTSSNPYVIYGYSTDEATWSREDVDATRIFDSSLTSHFVNLSGLPSDSEVYYRVCDDDGCGEYFWFRTAPVDNKPFVVVAGGDTRTGWDIRREGNKLISKIRPLFIMHGGDYTSSNNADEMKQLLTDWRLTYSEDMIDGIMYKRIYPVIATHGNHENGNYKTTCEVFGTDFNQDGVCSNADTYGAITISPLLRVYTLNSELRHSGYEADESNMNNWLSADLSNASSSVTWRFAQYHKPMFPHHSSKSEAQELFDWWANDFYDHGMNIVVESDSHVCKVTKVVKPSGGNFVEDSTGGTIYVGEGSWDAPARAADDAKSWTLGMESIQQLKVMTVGDDIIELRTAEFDGNVVALSRSVRNISSTILPDNIHWWSADNSHETLKVVKNDQHQSQMSFYENEPPVVTLVGNNPLILNKNGTFTDPGSNAIDDVDGDITSNIVMVNNIDLSTIGTYAMVYSVTDSAGNHTQVSRDVSVIDPNSPIILERRVVSSQDDAEEHHSDGDMSISSSDLEMIMEGDEQTVGIRFTHIDIPKNAVITKAYLQFQADETSTEVTELNIVTEDSTNAPVFQDISNNITDRSVISQTVIWNPPAWNSVGEHSEAQKTPELKSIIQPLIEKDGWQSGNAIVFIINGSGKRVAESFDGTSSGAPLLHIETQSTTPPSFSISNASENEGSNLNFTVTLSEAASSNITVNLSTVNGTATNPADFGSASSTSVTFTAEETSKTVSVPTVNDTIYDPSETMILRGTSSGTSNSSAEGRGTINDTDGKPTFSINDVSVEEGDNLSFVLTLSHASTQDIRIFLTTNNGTANKPDDFGNIIPDEVVFLAEETSKTIIVPTVDDEIDELNENMTLKGLPNTASEEKVANASAIGTGTIIDNDEKIIPDYIPTLNAQGTIVSGPTSAIDMVIRIGEFNDGENFEGDLMFTIVKNANLTLSFDPNETLRQGKMVQNTLWELIETSSLYLFTYIGNSRIFAKTSVSRVGVYGTFYSPSSAKGQFPLDITIVGGTGEVNLGNNKDTEILEYNNLT